MRSGVCRIAGSAAKTTKDSAHLGSRQNGRSANISLSVTTLVNQFDNDIKLVKPFSGVN
jgi:hypothetical protein